VRELIQKSTNNQADEKIKIMYTQDMFAYVCCSKFKYLVVQGFNDSLLIPLDMKLFTFGQSCIFLESNKVILFIKEMKLVPNTFHFCQKENWSHLYATSCDLEYVWVFYSLLFSIFWDIWEHDIIEGHNKEA